VRGPSRARGPSSARRGQMAFELYGTKGAVSWNLSSSTSCRST
jgi:hypothetical protein